MIFYISIIMNIIAHRDCNINHKLYENFLSYLTTLKSNHSYLVMQELSKFNLKINIVPNGLEKYMFYNQ